MSGVDLPFGLGARALGMGLEARPVAAQSLLFVAEAAAAQCDGSTIREHHQPNFSTLLEPEPAADRNAHSCHTREPPVERDDGRLKARLRPMRGLKTDRTASIVIRGHAFIQNVRRGHYQRGAETRHEQLRVAGAFDELAAAI